MPIRAERSDAGLSQCETVIDIRQDCCQDSWFSGGEVASFPPSRSAAYSPSLFPRLFFFRIDSPWMPLRHWQLAGQKRRAGQVAFIADLQESAALALRQRRPSRGRLSAQTLAPGTFSRCRSDRCPASTTFYGDGRVGKSNCRRTDRPGKRVGGGAPSPSRGAASASSRVSKTPRHRALPLRPRSFLPGRSRYSPRT